MSRTDTPTTAYHDNSHDLTRGGCVGCVGSSGAAQKEGAVEGDPEAAVVERDDGARIDGGDSVDGGGGDKGAPVAAVAYAALRQAGPDTSLLFQLNLSISECVRGTI